MLEGGQLFLHIRNLVVVNALQTPEYADIRFANHEGGIFYLSAESKRAPVPPMHARPIQVLQLGMISVSNVKSARELQAATVNKNIVNTTHLLVVYGGFRELSSLPPERWWEDCASV